MINQPHCSVSIAWRTLSLSGCSRPAFRELNMTGEKSDLQAMYLSGDSTFPSSRGSEMFPDPTLIPRDKESNLFFLSPSIYLFLSSSKMMYREEYYSSQKHRSSPLSSPNAQHQWVHLAFPSIPLPGHPYCCSFSRKFLSESSVVVFYFISTGSFPFAYKSVVIILMLQEEKKLKPFSTLLPPFLFKLSPYFSSQQNYSKELTVFIVTAFPFISPFLVLSRPPVAPFDKLNGLFLPWPIIRVTNCNWFECII